MPAATFTNGPDRPETALALQNLPQGWLDGFPAGTRSRAAGRRTAPSSRPGDVPSPRSKSPLDSGEVCAGPLHLGDDPGCGGPRFADAVPPYEALSRWSQGPVPPGHDDVPWRGSVVTLGPAPSPIFTGPPSRRRSRPSPTEEGSAAAYESPRFRAPAAPADARKTSRWGTLGRATTECGSRREAVPLLRGVRRSIGARSWPFRHRPHLPSSAFTSPSGTPGRRRAAPDEGEWPLVHDLLAAEARRAGPKESRSPRGIT